MDDLNQFTGADHSNDDKPVMASVLSLLLAVVSPLCCCCCAGRSLIILGASLCFGVVAVSKNWRGRAMAITGIVISSVLLVIVLGGSILFKDVIRDVNKLTANPQKYISQYEETGQVPVEFTKYKGEKYTKLWLSMGYDGFGEFYKVIIRQLKISYEMSVGELYDSGGKSDSDDPRPTETTAPTTLSVVIQG